MRTLIGHDESVTAWVSKKLNKPILGPLATIGWLGPDGTLKGAAVFNDFNGSNIEITICGAGTMTRQTIREAMRYAFVQQKVNRLSARTERCNKRMRQLMPRIGFTFESVAARYFGPHRRNDALVYRMLRADAERWLL